MIRKGCVYNPNEPFDRGDIFYPPPYSPRLPRLPRPRYPKDGWW